MKDFAVVMAEFAIRQAERRLEVEQGIVRLKGLVLPALAAARIARVEVRYDGCGDSGAVEDCLCFDETGAELACPDVTLPRGIAEAAGDPVCDEALTLAATLEQLTYLALERHHPGWEINDGACGELVIDVGAGSFVLGRQLRFIATDDQSTEL